MFLNRLSSEEKVAFLELAHHVARSDKDFSEDQKNIISHYCYEMEIEDISYDEENFDIHKTLSVVTNPKKQKIILLEIMALIYSDNILHTEEQKILDILIETYEFNSTLSIVYGEWTKAILALHVQGEALLEL